MPPNHLFKRLKAAANYALYLLDEAMARPGPQALVRKGGGEEGPSPDRPVEAEACLGLD